MNLVKALLLVLMLVSATAIFVKKFYPAKTWQQILFPMMNKEPESIHEI